MVSKKMTIENLATIVTEGFENMATKSDLENMATKSDLEDLAIMVAKGFEKTATKDDLKNGLDGLRFEMNERFEKVDERFEKLEDIIERMDREMVKKYDFEHVLSGYNNRLIKVEEHLNLK